MTGKIKKVSIIIPCFNTEQFLEDTIKSVLNQTFKKFDLYLIDNGSTDKSLSIMKKYKLIDPRIFIIKYKNKTPKGKSINDLLKKIKTKWVAILDADDIFFKNKINEQVKFLEKNKNVKLLGCLGKYTLDGKKSFGTTNNPFSNLHSCFDIIRSGKNIGVLAPGVIFDKDIVIRIGGIRYKFWPCDDLDLSNRIAENGYIVYSLPKELMLYRMSDISSMSTLKKFIEGKKKASWVKDSLNRRLKLKKEISFKSYCLNMTKQSLTSKLTNYFEDCSDFFFRSIITQILKKNILLIFYFSILSFIFNPNRFLKKVITRFSKII